MLLADGVVALITSKPISAVNVSFYSYDENGVHTQLGSQIEKTTLKPQELKTGQAGLPTGLSTSGAARRRTAPLLQGGSGAKAQAR